MMKIFEWFKTNKKENIYRKGNVVKNNALESRMFDSIKAPSMKDISSIPVDTNDGIRQYIARLRQMSRSMVFNDPFAKKHIRILVTNLVGENGLRPRCNFKQNDKLLLGLNKEIEKQFELWGKKPNCSISKRFSWQEIQKMVVTHVARDGEMFIRVIQNDSLPFGIALDLIDAFALDENLNLEKSNVQNRIIMGVEVDDYLTPIKYHFLARQANNYAQKHVTFAASEIIHVFMPMFNTQIRGIPWSHAAMLSLHNITKYQEAELIAARVEASKMGFLTPGDDDDIEGDAVDNEGNLSMDVSPGSVAVLRPGMEFKEWNPTHPNGNASEFIKSSLLGVSSALDVSYASLSSDLSKVSFSSIRHGEIKDRDNFKLDQQWLIENLAEPVFMRFMYAAMLKGKLKISPIEIENFYYPEWIAKRWDWVDPLKDTNASIEAVKNGFKSRTQIVAEMGRDFEDVARELATEEQLATELGIKILGDISNMQIIEDNSNANN